MVNTVIGYFAGGGGNRYLRYVTGEEFQTLNVAYDWAVENQPYAWRYLLDDNIVAHNHIRLTHCVNASRIREKFGNDCEIVILNFPLQWCLRREWALNGAKRYRSNFMFTETDFDKKIECYNAIRSSKWPSVETRQEYENLPTWIKQETEENFFRVIQSQLETIDLDSALASLEWQKNYYARYPLETTNCKVIHLNDDSDFCRIMIKELALYKSDIFDQAWRQVFGGDV